jgi:hypothetical protein
MAEKPDVRYGSYGDGYASRFVPGEAWVLAADGAWHEVNSAHHGEDFREMSKAEWEKKFPDAPPLPPEAFKTKR